MPELFQNLAILDGPSTVMSISGSNLLILIILDFEVGYLRGGDLCDFSGRNQYRIVRVAEAKRPLLPGTTK